MDRLVTSSSKDLPVWLEAARTEATQLFAIGVEAADPRRAVTRAMRFQDNRLALLSGPSTDASEWRCDDWSTIHVIAFGKAACATSEAAQAIIPKQKICGKGIAVTNNENVAATPNTDVFSAGHPLPDEAGLEAARLVARRVARAQAGELVLVLISGGGSALLPHPPDSVPLRDKISATELLLASGASIDETNTVRKHLSQLKGGRLAQLAAPASLHALILSDVIGDNLSAIASGPTVPDPSTFADAVRVLEYRQIWNKLPESVKCHIRKGCAGDIAETPKADDPAFSLATHALIGSNRMSLDAIEEGAKARIHRRTTILGTAMCGEARIAADAFVTAGAEALSHFPDEPQAVVAGGETTVTLKGSGLGGRNQEMALAFALSAEEKELPQKWIFLSGGTDGRDGPTTAAGGVVDPWTLDRIRTKGEDPKALLGNNDSNRALSASDDLLITGATGTNVADLQILLIN